MDFLRLSSTDPYFNMAFDQSCLQEPEVEEPVFWLWQNRPSVIIGLNQSAYAEVNLPYLKDHGIDLVRRVTGGGAVYHDLQNLNYTITGRSKDLDSDYPGFLRIVVEALRDLGVDASVSGRNDILVDGRKCSGYAKRVWQDRLMVHGTLMYDVDLEVLTEALAVPGSKLSAAGIASVRSRVANLKEYLPQFPDIYAFRDALEERMAAGGHLRTLSPERWTAIEKEAETKFRTWDWIYGRSPKADFRARRKFACGTVEAAWSVTHGHLDRLAFSGDFLGNLPAAELAAQLQGCRFDRASLLQTLDGAKIQAGDCFDGLQNDEFLKLFFEG